jgi:Ca2+-binding EF-hand superfamily protein
VRDAKATQLQIRKIDREFGLLDGDGRGSVEHRDYLRMAERFLVAFGASPGSRRGRAVIDGYTALWDHHRRAFDRDRDLRITREEFRVAVEMSVLRENGFTEVYAPLLRSIIALVDSPERGVLDRRDFTRLMGVFGVDPRDAAVTFAELDTDDDRRLTDAELIEAFRQYYFSTDPDTPANRLLGWLP